MTGISGRVKLMIKQKIHSAYCAYRLEPVYHVGTQRLFISPLTLHGHVSVNLRDCLNPVNLRKLWDGCPYKVRGLSCTGG